LLDSHGVVSQSAHRGYAMEDDTPL